MKIEEMCGQIDAEIAALQQRIHRLEEAKETIKSLRGPLEAGGYHTFEQSFTDGKAHVGETMTQRIRPSNSRSKAGSGRSFVSAAIGKKMPIKKKIAEVLSESKEPLSSADIIDRLGEGVKKQTVWAAVSDMTKRHVIEKVGDDRYRVAN